MTINLDTLKAALGAEFDEKGDYLVCGFDQKHTCEAKGYRLVGRVQDPSPGDSEMLIYDRRSDKFQDTKPGILGKLLGRS